MSKRKPVNVEIIKRTAETEAVDGVYGVMDSIIASCRPDLADVTIGLAWRYGWKPNADGFLRAGFCKKRGDLDRALDAFDFVILLNAEAWPEMTEPERRRLMHHELCHAQVCTDENGDTKFDTSGRPCCRVRKHDIEEFFEIAEVYGLDSTINQIAQAAAQDADRPLLKLAGRKEDTTEATETTEAGEDTDAAEVEGEPAKGDTDPPQKTICHKLVFWGLKQVACEITLWAWVADWRVGYMLKLGNYGIVVPPGESDYYSSRQLAMENTLAEMQQWLNGLPNTGTADQKRAFDRRRGMMREQITDQIKVLIDGTTEGQG